MNQGHPGIGRFRAPTVEGMYGQALINVCYRLHAEVDWNRGPNGEPAESPDGQCAPHTLSLARRTGEGVRRTGEGGGLGWKEFVPDYVGPFRDGTAACATENHLNPATA